MPLKSATSLIALAGLLAFTPAATAQRAAPSAGVRVDGSGQPYRAWDFAVVTGFHGDDEARAWLPGQLEHANWNGGWGLEFNLGRYWSSHLKTEASGGVLTTRDAFGYEDLAISGRPGQASWYGHGRRGYVSGAVTWQFLDNTFAHPFVTGGLHLNIVNVERERLGYAWVWDGTHADAITISPVNDHVFKSLPRAFVGVGCKSYFYNERTFMRSVLAFDMGQTGLSRWSLQTGFGVDF